MSEDIANIVDEDAVDTPKAEDRGDDFTPDEEELTELAGDDQAEGEDTEQGESESQEDHKEEPEVDASHEEEQKEPAPGVPHKRVSQITREKSITTDISDGIVEGTVDPQFVREMGGTKAVAKAIAKGELNIEDLAPTNKPRTDQDESSKTADELWDEYQQAVDAMDTDKARGLLKEARAKDKEESRADTVKAVREERQANKAQDDYDNANNIFIEAQKNNPTLADAESDDYADFSALYIGYLQSGNLSYTQAVKKALRRIAPEKKEEAVDEDAANETRKERKAKALKKAAQAQEQQPESLANASGARTRKVDVGALSDDEFSKLSPAEKRRARGDEL